MDLTAFSKFPSNIKLPPRKRKKESEKKEERIDRSKKEETKTPIRTDNAHSAHASCIAGLYPTIYPPVTPVLPQINAYVRRRNGNCIDPDQTGSYGAV